MTSPYMTRPGVSMPDPAYVRETNIDDLKPLELFKGVEEEALEQLLRTSRICELKVDEELWTTRRQIHYFYIIRTGYVVIWATSRFNGADEETLLAWRGPGQMLGEMRTLNSEASDVRINACDHCELLEMRLDTFNDVAAMGPTIYRNIANLLIGKMEWERHRSEVIRSRPATRRLAQALIFLAEERCEPSQFKSGKLIIKGSIHQEELAQYTGIGRETVNKHLVEFREQRIIKYTGSNRGNFFEILDLDRLEAIARNPSQEPPK